MVQTVGPTSKELGSGPGGGMYQLCDLGGGGFFSSLAFTFLICENREMRMTVVQISQGSYHKLLHIGRLEAAETCALTVLGVQEPSAGRAVLPLGP